MGQIVILGTANAIADERHENTHLAIVQGEQTFLVDSVGSPIVRLRQAGIDPVSLSGLFVTHFHPDHICSVPILLMDMWLLGRKQPFPIYGLDYTLDRLEKMMALYESQDWPGFFPVEYHRVPAQELFPALQTPGVRIFTSPVRHLLPTIGLRVEFPGSGKTVAYSCDTEPCEEVVHLGARADVLIHEATGESEGHSSAAQAGMDARQAEARSLYLIHYHLPVEGSEALITAARQEFAGPVSLAEDFQRIEL